MLSCHTQRFKINRRTVSDSGVSSLPIVKHLDILKDISLSVVPGSVSSMINTLNLQSLKKAFNDSVVPAISSATHAREYGMSLKELPVFFARILRALI